MNFFNRIFSRLDKSYKMVVDFDETITESDDDEADYAIQEVVDYGYDVYDEYEPPTDDGNIQKAPSSKKKDKKKLQAMVGNISISPDKGKVPSTKRRTSISLAFGGLSLVKSGNDKDSLKATTFHQSMSIFPNKRGDKLEKSTDSSDDDSISINSFDYEYGTTETYEEKPVEKEEPKKKTKTRRMSISINGFTRDKDKDNDKSNESCSNFSYGSGKRPMVGALRSRPAFTKAKSMENVFTGINEDDDDDAGLGRSNHSAMCENERKLPKRRGQRMRRLSITGIFGAAEKSESNNDDDNDTQFEEDKNAMGKSNHSTTHAKECKQPKRGGQRIRRMSITGIFGNTEKSESNSDEDDSAPIEPPKSIKSREKEEIKSKESVADSTNRFKSKNKNSKPRELVGQFEEAMKNAIKLNLKKKTTRIHASVEGEIENVFLDGLTSYPGSDTVLSHLHAATVVLQQFLNVSQSLGVSTDTKVNPSSESDIKLRLIKIFFREMETFLLEQITELYKDMDSISSEIAAKIVSWHFQFLEQIKQYCPHVSPLSDWRLDIARLLDYFIDSNIKMAVTCFGEQFKLSILTGDNDITEDPDGAVITSWPEDFADYLRIELNNNPANLPKPLLVDIFEAGSQIMARMISEIRTCISQNFSNISLRRYCTIVNDSTRAALLIGTIHEKYLASYCSSLHICNPGVAMQYDEKYSGMCRKAKRIEQSFTDLSLTAIRHLCENLMNLDKKFDMIGSSEWEIDKKRSTIKSVIGCFHSHFVDIQEWLLSNDMFDKVMKDCFEAMLQKYVEAYFTNTMTTGVKNQARSSHQLEQDYLDFTTFFSSDSFVHEVNPDSGISEQEFCSRLLIVLSMSHLLDPKKGVVDLVDDAKIVLERISTMGGRDAAAVMHLVGNRSKVRREEWLSIFLDIERQVFDSRLRCPNTNGLVNLPDMGSSPYLKNVTC